MITATIGIHPQYPASQLRPCLRMGENQTNNNEVLQWA